MAELTTLKIREFEKAHASLKESLGESDIKKSIMRDSSLLRFTLTVELATKALRMVLFDRFGIDALVPKTAYREARRVELLDENQTEICLRMVDDRNRMVHDYSEEFAHALFERVQCEYFPLFGTLLERLRT